MNTPLNYTNLGVMTPSQIADLWENSHLSQNVPQDFWRTLVYNLSGFNPDWYMFKNDIWHVRMGDIDYYFQKGLYDAAYETGLGFLGEDFINEMILADWYPIQYATILESIANATGEGHSSTNIVLNTYCDTNFVVEARSDYILCEKLDTVDSYLAGLSSKRRNSVKKSMEKAQGFQYHVYDSMSSAQIAWAVSHTVNNFGADGAGEDNGFILESSLHQWTLLTGLRSGVKFVDIWDNTGILSRKVAMLAFTERSTPEQISADITYDFYALALNRSYTGIGSAVLLESVIKITKMECVDSRVAFLLNTAPAPGEDYDPYVSYKKNVANRVLHVSSGLASHPDRDLPDYYTNVYNTKAGEWV